MGKTYPLPKNGKKRMIEQAAFTRKKHAQGPAYRQNINTKSDRKIHARRMSVTLKTLLKATDDNIIKNLDSADWLEDKDGTTCGYCEKGTLGPLRQYKSQGKKHRCNRNGCQKYTSQLAGHPIFITGRGTEQIPLQDQAAVVLCQLCNVSITATSKLVGMKINQYVLDVGNERLDFRLLITFKWNLQQVNILMAFPLLRSGRKR